MKSDTIKLAKLARNILIIVTVVAVFAVIVASILGFRYPIVQGNSMSPTIKRGALAVVQPVASTDIEVGDIITYKPSKDRSTIVTHRVVEVLGQEGSLSFRTAGDMNQTPDAKPIPSSNVIGKVRLHIPFLGFIVDFMKQPVGFGLLVGLPSVAIILWEIRRIRTYIRLRKQENQQEFS